MKKINRVLSVLLLFSVVLLPLVSCHAGVSHEAFEVPEQFDTSKEYEISFWAKNDTNDVQIAVYHKAIADFEAIYPNIHVKLKLYNDYGRIYRDVITNLQTNTTPNVCITYPDHIATYKAGKNTVVALDALLTDPKYGLGGSEIAFDAPSVNEIVPQFLEEGKIKDVQYALPFMRSTEACYINKTYVEKLGYSVPDVLTWDFIFEVSKKAAEKDADGKYKVNGQEIMIPFIYKSTDNMMIQMLKQKDADYSTEGGDVLIFNEDTKDILYTVADAVEANAFSTFKIESYPANYLNAGQCIFAIDSTAGAGWMGTEAPFSDIDESKVVKFETVVRAIPQYDVENPKMISQGPSVCLFAKKDDGEVLASWIFMQFLLTNSVQLGYAQSEGYIPVTTKAQQSEAYLAYLSNSGKDNDTHYSIKIDASKLMLENIDSTFITPVFNGSANLRNAAGQMIEEVTKSIQRNDTVDDAYMTQLYQKMIALYDLVLQTGDAENDEESKEVKKEFGDFPIESTVLLCALGVIWVLIGGYFGIQTIKKRKK